MHEMLVSVDASGRGEYRSHAVPARMLLLAEGRMDIDEFFARVRDRVMNLIS